MTEDQTPQPMSFREQQRTPYEVLTGQRFGKLLVISEADRLSGKVAWNCICDCGGTKVVTTGNLKHSGTKSCGCIPNKGGKRPPENLVGQKFGKLTVIEVTDKRSAESVVWLCQCECGNMKNAASRNLKNGDTKSCGCLFKWNNPGFVHRIFYMTWNGIIQRCYNPQSISYKNYGAKGVIVCDEWKNDYWQFHRWAIANGLKRGLTVDRYPDKNGIYSPENCRVATTEMQANNRNDNVFIEIDGVSKTVSQWARQYNQKPGTIFDRLRHGWDIMKALTTGKLPHSSTVNKRGFHGRYLKQ